MSSDDNGVQADICNFDRSASSDDHDRYKYKNVVHKARISASFMIGSDGAVQEVRPPRWCDLDERGVLRPSKVTW